MEDKKLNFKIQAQGELELAVSCALGNYYVDLKHEMFYFEPESDEKPCEFMSSIISLVAAMKGSESARLVAHMHAQFASLSKEHVTKVDDEKYTYNIVIAGELEPIVDSVYGTLYASVEHKCCYFESAHKGFMRPIEKKKFIAGLKGDFHGSDEQRKDGAEIVMKVIREFIELDDNDIVRNEAS